MNWPALEHLRDVSSPGLLVDADRVADNIAAMIAMVGGQAARLRPHVKTHKMAEPIRLQVAAGITRFKTATLAETQLAAQAGGSDVLLAYQPVGPNVDRLQALRQQFPQVSFATITDDPGVAEMLAARLGNSARPLRLFIDVDCGMHRTGIAFGPALDALRARIESLAGVTYAGLHVYDGHLHAPALGQRSAEAAEVIDAVRRYDSQHPSPTIVAGGSPTFACWAQHTPWECSPGTPVFWDAGYGGSFPELPFAVAITLLTRVISKPGDNRVCLDLGYKSVASEVGLANRVVLPAISDAEFVGQSEEHLVIKTAQAPRIAIGQPFLAVPRHVCPTVALHALATVVREGRLSGETWRVAARDRL